MLRVWHRIDDWMLRLSWVPSLVLVIAMGLIAVQASDRREPFQILSVEPAAARPGDMVTIRAKVWRDQSRNCSAVMSRSVLDAQAVRWDYPLTRFSDAMIDRMESLAPGELRVSIVVPSSASAGRACCTAASPVSASSSLLLCVGCRRTLGMSPRVLAESRCGGTA